MVMILLSLSLWGPLFFIIHSFLILLSLVSSVLPADLGYHCCINLVLTFTDRKLTFTHEKLWKQKMGALSLSIDILPNFHSRKVMEGENGEHFHLKLIYRLSWVKVKLSLMKGFGKRKGRAISLSINIFTNFQSRKVVEGEKGEQENRSPEEGAGGGKCQYEMKTNQ